MLGCLAWLCLARLEELTKKHDRYITTEATTIALLNTSQFPTAIVLTTVACFRVVSILAEAIAAGLAYTISRK